MKIDVVKTKQNIIEESEYNHIYKLNIVSRLYLPILIVFNFQVTLLHYNIIKMLILM